VDAAVWVLIIGLHAAAAVCAFAVGVAAIDPDRADSHQWMLLAPAGLPIPMTVSMVAAMPAHWLDLPGAAQNPFVAPVGLALHMVYRAGHASGLVNQEPPSSDSRHVDDSAFMLLDGVGHLQRHGRAALG
jgi:hypothetical protein